jgi:hypothetical protein
VISAAGKVNQILCFQFAQHPVNILVVDNSVTTTGFGLDPMITVITNALHVGTFIADTLSKGGDPTK